MDWSTVPFGVLEEIFVNLPIADRHRASLVCKNWSECVERPKIWSRRLFSLEFSFGRSKNAYPCIDQYGCYLKDVEIVFSFTRSSCEKVSYVMDKLGTSRVRNLRKFALRCNAFLTHEDDEEFLQKLILAKLKDFLALSTFNLTFVDLNQCCVAIDDELISILSRYHSNLRIAKLQNDKRDLFGIRAGNDVTPSALLQLVERCPIEELHTYYRSIDSAVLEALGVGGRANFRSMYLICEVANQMDIVPSASWSKFVKSNPKAEVTMEMYEPRGCSNRICDILSPGIPLTSINLAAKTKEIEHICQHYSVTLRRLMLRFVLSTGAGFETALLDFVSKCDRLKHFYCDVALEQHVIDKIKLKKNLISTFAAAS